MAWTPTKNILTSRAIPDNILAYVLDATRQAEALTWAGGTGQKLVKKLTASAAGNATVYPCIQLIDDNDAQDTSEDIIQAAYICTFEISVTSQTLETAITQAKVYAKAFCSMMINMPSYIAGPDISTDTGLGGNTGGTRGTARILQVDTAFDPIKANDKRNEFLQQFQIRLTVSLTGPSYL